MKTATGIQTMIDVNALKTQLEELGYGKDLVNSIVNFAEAETGKKEQNMNANPVPTDNMNPVPTVMKPISHLKKAVRYSAVWAEPGKPLGPNADIPSLAEASDEDIGEMPEEEKEDDAEGEENKTISPEEAQQLGEEIGIVWEAVEFTPEALAEGMTHELEHGSKDKETNVTDDDPIMTAKIAWAHLKEDPEYYTKLNMMEEGDGGEEKEDEEGEEESEEEEDAGESSEQKPVGRFQAMLSLTATTVRELQQVVIPQMEEQLFEADAALQAWENAGDSKLVADARSAIFEAQASLDTIKEKVLGLGDVDPVTYGGEQPKQKGLLDKLFK